ncbi:TetR/AcrR family transcriptional regulator [Flavisphingomonas formosensis]|uniref:TetR/AcrR family transcriptional regulator n=1 Tax=Flavisphingomonas formosensis TaxID=861534 RepID=UPI0012F9BFDB|nr:TetR/AcrR family transcriptional regulator [Sphingomonas formosensis]
MARRSGKAMRASGEEGGAGLPETRRRAIQEIAGTLFASRGYEATSMRDLAAAAGLMPASLYHHFSSKEELFVSVAGESVAKMQRALEAGIAGVEDPWARLEAALIAHAEALLDRSGFRVLVVLMYPPGLSEQARETLGVQREPYERIFRELLAAVPFPEGVDRAILRKLLLSMMNSISIWYRPEGSASPRDIAHQILLILRHRAAEA